MRAASDLIYSFRTLAWMSDKNRRPSDRTMSPLGEQDRSADVRVSLQKSRGMGKDVFIAAATFAALLSGEWMTCQ